MKKIFVVLGVAIAGYVTWRALTPSAVDAQDEPSLLDGRVWVEKLPDKETQHVHGAFFLNDAEIAVFHRASSFEAHLELAEYGRNGENAKLTFPQSGRKADFSFTVRGCNEVKPFDLCLDISKNPWGGPRRYYGFRDPDREDGAIRQMSRTLRAQAPR